jgi:hypothetical protein
MVSEEGPINPEFQALSPEETRPVSKDDVPDGLTVEQTEDWVSGDKQRAAAALAAEESKDNARTTLVESLRRLVNNEDNPASPTGPQVSSAISPDAEGTV